MKVRTTRPSKRCSDKGSGGIEQRMSVSAHDSSEGGTVCFGLGTQPTLQGLVASLR